MLVTSGSQTGHIRGPTQLQRLAQDQLHAHGVATARAMQLVGHGAAGSKCQRSAKRPHRRAALLIAACGRFSRLEWTADVGLVA
jgi:hypothetical protein